MQGIAELITRPGLINVDFADVRTVMSEMGMAMMGSGRASGEDRAREAAEAAISSPLLEDMDLAGARGILVNVTAGMDLSIGEFQEVGDTVKEFASDDATVVVGTVIDPDMGDASGSPSSRPASAQRRPCRKVVVDVVRTGRKRSNGEPNYHGLDKPTVQRKRSRRRRRTGEAAACRKTAGYPGVPAPPGRLTPSGPDIPAFRAKMRVAGSWRPGPLPPGAPGRPEFFVTKYCMRAAICAVAHGLPATAVLLSHEAFRAWLMMTFVTQAAIRASVRSREDGNSPENVAPGPKTMMLRQRTLKNVDPRDRRRPAYRREGLHDPAAGAGQHRHRVPARRSRRAGRRSRRRRATSATRCWRRRSWIADGAKVATVEHLMSAFAGLGIDNAYVDLSAPEVPIMDGSAAPFVFLLQSAGIEEQNAPKALHPHPRAGRVEDGDKWARTRAVRRLQGELRDRVRPSGVQQSRAGRPRSTSRRRRSSRRSAARARSVSCATRERCAP